MSIVGLSIWLLVDGVKAAAKLVPTSFVGHLDQQKNFGEGLGLGLGLGSGLGSIWWQVFVDIGYASRFSLNSRWAFVYLCNLTAYAYSS